MVELLQSIFTPIIKGILLKRIAILNYECLILN